MSGERRDECVQVLVRVFDFGGVVTTSFGGQRAERVRRGEKEGGKESWGGELEGNRRGRAINVEYP